MPAAQRAWYAWHWWIYPSVVKQPMWSLDRRVAILFNGEIYNFRAERERLQAAGYRFLTTTDTEVVLNLYLENGLEFHEHLRGMYALAIFDLRQSAPGEPAGYGPRPRAAGYQADVRRASARRSAARRFFLRNSRDAGLGPGAAASR